MTTFVRHAGWDILGQKIHEITPPVQTLLTLEAALHWEWQQWTQHLAQGMRRLSSCYHCSSRMLHEILTQRYWN